MGIFKSALRWGKTKFLDLLPVSIRSKNFIKGITLGMGCLKILGVKDRKLILPDAENVRWDKIFEYLTQ